MPYYKAVTEVVYYKVYVIANFKQLVTVRKLRNGFVILNFKRKFFSKAAQMQAPLSHFLKNSKRNAKWVYNGPRKRPVYLAMQKNSRVIIHFYLIHRTM